MGRHEIKTEPKPDRRIALRKRAAWVFAAAGIVAMVKVGVPPRSDVVSKTLKMDCAREPHKAITDEISGNQVQIITLESGITITVAANLGRIALDPGDYKQYPQPGTIIIENDEANLVSGRPNDITGLYEDATKFVTLTCSLPPQQDLSGASVPVAAG